MVAHQNDILEASDNTLLAIFENGGRILVRQSNVPGNCALRCSAV